MKKIIFLTFLLFLISCKCPESQSIVNFSETNLQEYKRYVLEDKNLSEDDKAIRLLRVKTFKAVADGLRD